METWNTFLFNCEDYDLFNEYLKFVNYFALIKKADYDSENKVGKLKVAATCPLMMVFANSFHRYKEIANTINYEKHYTGEKICQGWCENISIVHKKAD